VFLDLLCLQISIMQNLVSDFTCFLLVFHYFLMGMDLRVSISILLSSESFAPKFWEMIKMQF